MISSFLRSKIIEYTGEEIYYETYKILHQDELDELDELFENDLIHDDLIHDDLIHDDLIHDDLIHDDLHENELNKEDLIQTDLIQTDLIQTDLIQRSTKEIYLKEVSLINYCLNRALEELKNCPSNYFRVFFGYKIYYFSYYSNCVCYLFSEKADEMDPFYIDYITKNYIIIFNKENPIQYCNFVLKKGELNFTKNYLFASHIERSLDKKKLYSNCINIDFKRNIIHEYKIQGDYIFKNFHRVEGNYFIYEDYVTFILNVQGNPKDINDVKDPYRVIEPFDIINLIQRPIIFKQSILHKYFKDFLKKLIKS